MKVRARDNLAAGLPEATGSTTREPVLATVNVAASNDVLRHLPGEHERPHGLRRDVLNARGFVHLVQALAFGEGFAFHVVVVRTAATAKMVLRLLPEEVARLGGSVRVARIDPHPFASAEDPIPLSRSTMASEVLERLLAEQPMEWESQTVFALDASSADSSEDDAWNWLFRRMNERREAIRRSLHGPLLVCLPERLERFFMWAAPDLWSVRSVVAHIDTVSPPALLGEFGEHAQQYVESVVRILGREVYEELLSLSDAETPARYVRSLAPRLMEEWLTHDERIQSLRRSGFFSEEMARFARRVADIAALLAVRRQRDTWRRHQFGHDHGLMLWIGESLGPDDTERRYEARELLARIDQSVTPEERDLLSLLTSGEDLTTAAHSRGIDPRVLMQRIARLRRKLRNKFGLNGDM